MWKYKLLKNKLCSLALLLLGFLPIMIDGEGTFFLFILFLSVPLFFAKEDCIVTGKNTNSGTEKGEIDE